MRPHVIRWIPVALLAAACHAAPPAPVPLSGTRANLDQLAGEWSGSYSNPENGRSGSIVFTLTAGEDHAHGDIVMVPAGTDRPLRPYVAGSPGSSGQMPSSQVLTIEFVRVSGDSVSGTIVSYLDPECQCAAHAIFRGRVDGNRIRGTFASFQGQSERASHGTWEVQKR
jgi:hypothetical protein